jgi:lambda repressor-like predicted transcriptional regulator
LTDNQIAQLVAEYQAGLDMAVLALPWELHRTTVAAHLRRAGVVLRGKAFRPSRSPKQIRLYSAGWSLQRLAERYRCDDETVRTELKRAGIRLPKPWERV